MDVTPLLEDMFPAPRVLFESLEARRSRPRFMLPDGQGDWEAITWGAFADEVEDIALMLHNLGLKPTERATIFGYNSVSWMSAALGIQVRTGQGVHPGIRDRGPIPGRPASSTWQTRWRPPADLCGSPRRNELQP